MCQGVVNYLLRTPLVDTLHPIATHRMHELRPATMLEVFEGIDAFRRPERLEILIAVCIADVRGRLGFEKRQYDQPATARAAFEAARAIDAGRLAASGLKGPQIGEALHRERINAIAEAIGRR